ncbi:hypothetical protein JCM33374_g3571 [Metschnikowia sp. JCM 33374]|nr:hypothetical protein JCM33374_g3571 [Metschnikowia sp. JCM 33374]
MEPNVHEPKSENISSGAILNDITIEQNISSQFSSSNLTSPFDNAHLQNPLENPFLSNHRTYTLKSSANDCNRSNSEFRIHSLSTSCLKYTLETNTDPLSASEVFGDVDLIGTSCQMKQNSVLSESNLLEEWDQSLNRFVLPPPSPHLAFGRTGNREEPPPKLPNPVPSTNSEEENHSFTIGESVGESLGRPLGKSHISATKILNPKSEFQKLAPFLKDVNSNNFARFLVRCLKDCHQQIPIFGLFQLLYSDKYPEYDYSSQSSGSHVENTSFCESERKGLQYCDIILERFRNIPARRVAKQTTIQKYQLAGISFHEVLRTLAAIKIIFSSVVELEYNSMSDSRVERASVYKVYFVICQMLIQRHTASRISSTNSNETLILSNSSVGKLMKLIYPNLMTRRLGKRGNSKYYYIGLAWNQEIVTKEVLALLDLDIPSLRQHFSRAAEKLDKRSLSESYTNTKIPQIIQTNVSKGVSNPSVTHSKMRWKTPPHSFVEVSSTYPESDCSPRLWKTKTNQVPQKSQWSKETMGKSVLFLRAYNIDLDPLIENFSKGNFCGGHQKSLASTFFRAMSTLHSSKSEEDTYMHLYVVILLLVFPMVISSEDEIPRYGKLELRSSIQQCIHQSEYDMPLPSDFDNRSLRAFTGILRSMLHLVDLTMTKIQADCTELVLNKMVRELETSSLVQGKDSKIHSPLEKYHLDSIILTMKALDFKFGDPTSETDEIYEIDHISSLAKVLVKSINMTKDTMSVIPTITRSEGLKHVPEDLPYQVFIIGLKFFHEFTLVDPIMLKVPIAVFNSIWCHVSNLVPACNFEGFLNTTSCHPQLPKESFKCCWVLCSMIQEYLKILSEIVALSTALRKLPEKSWMK